MSGIIPGVALVNNFDSNGDLMVGALLRIYEAGTTTPVTAYKDSGLTAGQEHPWPIEADAAGRLPMFWLEDGDYRVRLVSADGGDTAYDLPVISAIGASSGEGEGGGGAGVSQEVLHQTGDLKARLGSGTHAGWVRLNARSIGSASSGASERANSDTESLYEYLWSEFDNTVCPVAGGRGASAAADFAANKALTLPDGRGRGLFGVDGMGNTNAGRLTTATFATPTAVGTGGGTETHTLTAAQLAAHTHTASVTDPGHTHTYDDKYPEVGPPNTVGGASAAWQQGASHSSTTGSGTTGITVAVNANTGGEAHNNMPPGLLVTFYVKL